LAGFFIYFKILKLLFNVYSVGICFVVVTILSTTDKLFKGFMIQARRINPNLTLAEREEPVGYFDLADGLQTICGGTDGQGVCICPQSVKILEQY